MHELPVVTDIIKNMDRETEEHGYKKITDINLVIGELSSVVGECVQMYFDMMSEGHSCENARLNFTHTRARLKCTQCGHEFEHESSFSCPECGGDGMLIKGTGREFLIRSINAE